MPLPLSLQPIERSRISDAVRLESAGVPVRWRIAGRKVSYVAGGKVYPVTSAPTDRVFAELVRQLKLEYASLAGSSPASVPAQRGPAGSGIEGLTVPSAGKHLGEITSGGEANGSSNNE